MMATQEYTKLRRQVFSSILYPSKKSLMGTFSYMFDLWNMYHLSKDTEFVAVWEEARHFAMRLRGNPKRYVDFVFSPLKKTLQNHMLRRRMKCAYTNIECIGKRISTLIDIFIPQFYPFTYLSSSDIAKIFIMSIEHAVSIFYFRTYRHIHDVTTAIEKKRMRQNNTC